jgi:hypothetical protein
MKKTYEYLFYRFYRYMETTRNHEHSAHGALIYLSIIILFNSFTFLVYLKNIFGIDGINNIILLIYAIIIYFINKRYFDNENTTKRIVEMFQHESNKHEVIGKISVVVLIVLTFLLLATSYQTSIKLKEIW